MRTVLISLSILLLIGTSASEGEFPIKVSKKGDVFTLTCSKGISWKKDGNIVDNVTDTITLTYKDENSGEYECEDASGPVGTYYVKFRTCDTCIELDWEALTGIIIGNVVATILIGVAVYYISTQSKGPSFPSNKASQESDRRNLISNDSTYQSLTNSGRDAYEVLNTRRR